MTLMFAIRFYSTMSMLNEGTVYDMQKDEVRLWKHFMGWCMIYLYDSLFYVLVLWCTHLYFAFDRQTDNTVLNLVNS